MKVVEENASTDETITEIRRSNTPTSSCNGYSRPDGTIPLLRCDELGRTFRPHLS
jgi:hypothetical protein